MCDLTRLVACARLAGDRSEEGCRTAMTEAAQLLLSAVIGAAGGAFATAYKSRKELESLYDIELRRRRIDAYAELWKLLEPLAYWSPPGPVTFAGVTKLSRALRGWYFRTGGLVLSS